MTRALFDDTHEMFRDSFRQFVAREIVPFHDRWDAAGIVDRSMFAAAGAAGFLGFAAPEQYGGGGTEDFRYNLVIAEELAKAAVVPSGVCIVLHNDVCMPYVLR